jgi:hypothetical protein
MYNAGRHVRNAVTPRNLVASIIALNVREARHIATTSSVNLHMRVHACMIICKAASMHWRTGDERKAEQYSRGRAHARTRPFHRAALSFCT